MLNRKKEKMLVTFHFGPECLFDGYLICSDPVVGNLLIISH
jgi:hypothetical protein